MTWHDDPILLLGIPMYSPLRFSAWGVVGLGNVGKAGRTCGVGGGRAGAPSWSEDSRISRLRMGSVFAKICMYGPSSRRPRSAPPSPTQRYSKPLGRMHAGAVQGDRSCMVSLEARVWGHLGTRDARRGCVA